MINYRGTMHIKGQPWTTSDIQYALDLLASSRSPDWVAAYLGISKRRLHQVLKYGGVDIREFRKAHKLSIPKPLTDDK